MNMIRRIREFIPKIDVEGLVIVYLDTNRANR